MSSAPPLPQADLEPMFQQAEELWRLMGCPRCELTGGWIRDSLLGRPSSDLDFALEGDTHRVQRSARRLARALGTRAHLLGKELKSIWRINGGGLKIELWPRGSLSIEQDIQRRDLTCNALVWQLPERRLIDLVGGVKDLQQRVLRAISRENLAADPVRLLRVARFLAKLDHFSLDPATAQWVGELAPLLADAPRERVGQELLSLLSSRGVRRGLEALLELGLFVPAAPAMARPDTAWITDHLEAATLLSGAGPHPVTGAVATAGDAARIALLLRSWRLEDQRQAAPYSWLRPLRLTATVAAGLLDRALTTASASAADRRQLIADAGHSFPAVLALAAAVASVRGSDPRPWRRWWRQWQRSGPALVQPSCLLPAAEVAALTGVPPGVELGRQIRRLVTAQVRGHIRTPAGARRFLRSMHQIRNK